MTESIEKDSGLIKFSPAEEDRAISLAAYDIVRQMIEEGLIEGSLEYLQKKYNIMLEKICNA